MHRHHWHAPHIFIHLPDEVRHFYEMSAVKRFLDASIGVFVPAYVVAATGRLEAGIVYLALRTGAFTLPAGILTLHVLRRWGLEVLMWLSIAALVATGTVVALLPLTPLTIVVVAALDALQLASFWDAYHVSFGVFGRRRETIREVAANYVVLSAIGVVTPVITGVSIYALGYHATYVVLSALGVGLATLMLRHFGKSRRVHVNIRDVLGAQPRRPWFISGMYLAVPYLVPLYVFYATGNSAVVLGGYTSLVALISSIAAIYTGRKADTGDIGPAKAGTIADAAIIGSYSVIRSPSAMVAMDSLRAPLATTQIGFYHVFYGWASGDPARILARALWIRAGKLLALSFAMVAGLGPTFILGMLAELAYLREISWLARRLRGSS